MPREEARALDEAIRFLLDLSSGKRPVNGHARELRAEARRIAKHFPMAAGHRWLNVSAD